ncbi:MAG: M23 family metallopeptidase [Meiothermus sp.]|nr:M23 family metallopeptidase [Meiothermus sp.]
MKNTLAFLLLLALSACVWPRSSPPNPGSEAPDESPGTGWTRLDDYGRLLAQPPDGELLMPVRGVQVRQVTDTFLAPRPGGRLHEGQDIFAPRGIPVYAATEGVVVRMGYGQLGGLFVMVLGPGGRRYYYAHLDRHAEGLQEGDWVSRQTLLGYVGNTGNARATPPHLHFGVYGSRWRLDDRVINPLPLLANRNWQTLDEKANDP